MLEMARRRPTPPSLLDPPAWLTELSGFELFRVDRSDTGWSAFPDGVDEHVEFPGGTWRVTLVMPVDLSLIDGVVDPLLLLVALADGAAKVDDKIAELVAHARASGKSWTEIGQALGITKQSAWERFSGVD
jgi:hypothetical protein